MIYLFSENANSINQYSMMISVYMYHYFLIDNVIYRTTSKNNIVDEKARSFYVFDQKLYPYFSEKRTIKYEIDDIIYDDISNIETYILKIIINNLYEE